MPDGTSAGLLCGFYQYIVPSGTLVFVPYVHQGMGSYIAPSPGVDLTISLIDELGEISIDILLALSASR